MAVPFAVRTPACSYSGQPFHNPPIPSPSNYRSPPYLMPPGLSYPTTNIHPYMYNQQVCLGYEGERRRMPQCSQVNPEHLLNALNSSISATDQIDQTATDSLIHDEVTRAAKTLFTKRNRTLMHWLRPNISKNELKIFVNATWERLEQSEKMLYISQVLGKFAPHTTSLMVNPQLGPTSKESEGQQVPGNKKTSNDAISQLIMVMTRQTQLETIGAVEGKLEQKPHKRKAEHCSEDKKSSCDSSLVMDSAGTEKAAVEMRVKRKYKKRQSKNTIKEKMFDDENCNSCTPPVNICDIKKEINEGPEESTVAKVKRKYSKRTLVRKKYKKREPKRKMLYESTQEATISSTVELEQPEEDRDIWRDLINDADLKREIEGFSLLEEDVDRFWDNIDNPNNLFTALEIE